MVRLSSLCMLMKIPLIYWAIMIPELPRAPFKAASAIEFIVSFTVEKILASSIIEIIVEARLLPVSPSETGKTLISFNIRLFRITS